MTLFRAVAVLVAALALSPAALGAELEPPLPRPRPALPTDAASPAAVLSAENDAPIPRRRPDLPPQNAVDGPAASPLRGDGAGTASAELVEAAEPLAGPADALAHVARLPRHAPADARSAALALWAPGDADDFSAPAAPMAPSGDDLACLARLRSLGVVFERLEPIAPGEACYVDLPLNVTSLGSNVAIAPEAILNCRTAEALAIWVRDSLVPSARTRLGASPTKIVHGSTYVCRPRNNVAGAKLSEHANANAVDIGSIAFADRAPFEVKEWPENSPEGRFAADIRAESCDYFTTVLGPGSNAAHASHFHFDMAERRSGYRLCELGEPEVAEFGAPKTKRE